MKPIGIAALAAGAAGLAFAQRDRIGSMFGGGGAEDLEQAPPMPETPATPDAAPGMPTPPSPPAPPPL